MPLALAPRGEIKLDRRIIRNDLDDRPGVDVLYRFGRFYDG